MVHLSPGRARRIFARQRGRRRIEILADELQRLSTPTITRGVLEKTVDASQRARLRRELERRGVAC